MSQHLEFNQWEGSGPLTPNPVGALSTTHRSTSRHSIPFQYPPSLLFLSLSLSLSLSLFLKTHIIWNLLLASLLPTILLVIAIPQQGGSRREAQVMPRVAGWCLWVQTGSQTLQCPVASPREEASSSLDQYMKILKASHNSICPVQCFLRSVHFIYKYRFPVPPKKLKDQAFLALSHKASTGRK